MGTGLDVTVGTGLNVTVGTGFDVTDVEGDGPDVEFAPPTAPPVVKKT